MIFVTERILGASQVGRHLQGSAVRLAAHFVHPIAPQDVQQLIGSKQFDAGKAIVEVGKDDLRFRQQPLADVYLGTAQSPRRLDVRNDRPCRVNVSPGTGVAVKLDPAHLGQNHPLAEPIRCSPTNSPPV